jgi:hypothetical protein
VTDDEPRDEEADADHDGPTAEDVRTPVEGHADGVEERPDAAEQPDADAPPAEATLDRPAEVV